MNKLDQISEYESCFTTKIDKNEKEIEEYDFNPNSEQRNDNELVKLYNENYVEENELYSIFIRNDIALNLYLSLYKLKRGPNYQNLFKHPCQIKIYPKTKLMIIYLIVNFNFLRIKIELQNIEENLQLLSKNKNLNSKSVKIEEEIQESPILNINNKNEDEINEKEENDKEIIFTIELIDLFNMLDSLLCENKEYPLAFSIDDCFTILTGKILCPDVFDQSIFSTQIKCELLKNESFSYKISSPNEIQSKKNNFFGKGMHDEDSGNDDGKKRMGDSKDGGGGEDDDNSSQKKDSEINSKNNNNTKQKENIQLKNDNNNEFESMYLEQKFMMDHRCAKYIIEGTDLVDLYYFMKGLDILYNDFSAHIIGISFINEKAFFYCPAIEKILDGRNYENLSSNINQQMKINIKSVKDHFLTPFKYGFNSLYRTKFLSKFIMSFYNKDDKRLLVKVTPKGKMILSYTFSNPRNDLVNEQNNNGDNLNKKSISEEINSCIDDVNENDFYENDGNNRAEMGKIRRKKIIKDRLIDDENRGNIVEMIFYPVVFDICKS
jgi:hypothetical protein